jgi:putative peptide zinc metalloprotease protein
MSAQVQGSRLAEAFGIGDMLAVLARLLGLVAIVVPVLGIGFVLLRLVRRTGLGVWRRTEGRPVRRALTGLVAAALVAGLCWAWWPDADTYRPVRAWEGGTVLDAVPASSSSGLGAGSRGAATTVWPDDGGPLPTADHPALAMVLVPKSQGADGSGGTSAEAAPTWVFPFDRPLPPGEGDNQALAVNTEDGSVAYDVSFSLVWVEEGDAALNRNEAYAAASCRDCRTVAVAFQVVLLVGSVDVVVPQNLSTAVNYACLECVTYALATQLVVTVPGPLSDEAAQELAAIWAELQAFGVQIEGVPLAELRDRLTDFEARILDVVRPDMTTAPEDTSGVPETSGVTDGRSSSGAPASTSRSQAPGTEEAAPTTAPTTSGTTAVAPTTEPASSSAAGTTAEATASG